MKRFFVYSVMSALILLFFSSNVLVSVIAAKWQYRIGYHPVAFKPRQGGVNTINYQRIFRIGCRALVDFWKINQHLSSSEK